MKNWLGQFAFDSFAQNAPRRTQQLVNSSGWSTLWSILFFPLLAGNGKGRRLTFCFSTTTRGLTPDTRPTAQQPTGTVSGLQLNLQAVQHCGTFQLDYLCALFFFFFWVLFPTAKHSENNLSVSPFELELKWVDFDKPRNKIFNFNIIAFHPHTEYTPLTPLAPPAPPQLQSPKLKLQICTVSELVCLCVGWRRGRHQHSNPHHVFVQKQLSGSLNFGNPQKERDRVGL